MAGGLEWLQSPHPRPVVSLYIHDSGEVFFKFKINQSFRNSRVDTGSKMGMGSPSELEIGTPSVYTFRPVGTWGTCGVWTFLYIWTIWDFFK